MSGEKLKIRSLELMIYLKSEPLVWAGLKEIKQIERFEGFEARQAMPQPTRKISARIGTLNLRT